MTTLDSTTREADFYAQLMAEIESGNIDGAVAIVMALKERNLQIEILSQLAAALDHALDIRGANTLDLDRARALVRARDRANELALALDLDHAHALQLALDRARTLYLYLDRAEQINKTIVVCLTQIKDRDRSSSAKTVRVIKSTPAQDKRNRSRVIILALFCILVLVGVIALMVLQSKP